MNKKSKFKDFNLKIQGQSIKEKKLPLYKTFQTEPTKEENIMKVLNKGLYSRKFKEMHLNVKQIKKERKENIS